MNSISGSSILQAVDPGRWVGTKTYTVTLDPGTYAYACSVHFRTMNGTFVVT